ncbi:unnamed protein product [Heligmosomoides polygyrus]|uniref:Secreted protein n=1 Tax=Heligmosomoides polygyrus TaxID=6339 RepID=A0A183GPS0_HELPZ|nr:unnamed protein product [Heligmosomoides polygyrus]
MVLSAPAPAALSFSVSDPAGARHRCAADHAAGDVCGDSGGGPALERNDQLDPSADRRAPGVIVTDEATRICAQPFQFTL